MCVCVCAVVQGAAEAPEGVGVGDVDTTQRSGFCIGTAPVHARPPASPTAHSAGATSRAAMSSSGAARSGSPGRPASPSRMSVASPRLQPQQQQQQQLSARPGSPQLQGQKLQAADAGAPDAGGGAELLFDRNALFSKYKHSVADGSGHAEQVKQHQQQVAQLKQQIKVRGRRLVMLSAGCRLGEQYNPRMQGGRAHVLLGAT